VQARLVADWETTYGYKPVLLETYVERGRFEGTCYRAANWQLVGNTMGRGRQGDGVPVKDVFLFPLMAQWQTHLCGCADGTQKMREVVRQIQGLPAMQAQAVLQVVPRKSARFVAKTLRSAIANAENNKKLKPETLRVKEAVAGTATTIRRFMPKARGSAGPILKRRCHIKITLSDGQDPKDQ
jgi:ribosomal protein L22